MYIRYIHEDEVNKLEMHNSYNTYNIYISHFFLRLKYPKIDKNTN